MAESFKCDVCDHNTDTLSKHNRHLNTKKHLILLEKQTKKVDTKPLKKDKKSTKVLPTIKEAKEAKESKKPKEPKKSKEVIEVVDNRSPADIIKDLKGQVKLHQANEKRLTKELDDANEKNKDVTLQLCDALQQLYEMNRSDNPNNINKNSNNTITTTNNDIRIVNIYIHYTTDEELTELTSPEISRKITALITEFIPTDDCKQEFIDKYNESMPI